MQVTNHLRHFSSVLLRVAVFGILNRRTSHGLHLIREPFQGWGVGMTLTQDGASLTLGFNIEPPWGSRSKPRQIRSINERSHNNEMHGTPQGYLSCIVAGRAATSMNVKRCSTGARDLNAVSCRHICHIFILGKRIHQSLE